MLLNLGLPEGKKTKNLMDRCVCSHVHLCSTISASDSDSNKVLIRISNARMYATLTIPQRIRLNR